MLIPYNDDEYMNYPDENDVLRNGVVPNHRSSELHQALTREQERTKFARFCTALERLGASPPDGGRGIEGDDWVNRMADDLNWDPDEVEIYAYRYFVALLEEGRQEPTHDPVAPEVRESTRNGSGRPWSPDECILFDTLVAQYRTGGGGSGGRGNGISRNWEISVAEHLPGRTVSDVRRRFRQLESTFSVGNGAT